MPPIIESIRAYEILDSRGNPTVAARVTLSNGVTAMGHAPSGASTGKHEAVELRDGDARYGGKGVRSAVRNIEEIILPALRGIAADLASVDARMIELDGTTNKSRLGANAMLAVSCAVARASAFTAGQPLWRWLERSGAPTLPVPMVNIISGGLHAGRNIEFQDFLVIAHGFDTYSEALHAVTRVHRQARVVLDEHGHLAMGVADEGGWGPSLPSNEAALEIVTEAIERAGYQPREQLSIALDVAASHFHEDGEYNLPSERRTLTTSEMISLLAQWTSRYPVVSVEDALEEDDWTGWRELTTRLGSKLQIVGDDLFTTNPQRLQHGVDMGSANAILVKMNQIGTVTETLEVLELAHSHGYAAVVSARSGETEDSFLADLAVAGGMGQIKVGSITRSERLAKYNRLLEIEKDDELPFYRLSLGS